MTDNEHDQVDEEIRPLKIFRGDGEPGPPDPQPEGDDPAQKAKREEFWAGRNHAMRRSARVAA
jgi:hypothetical protein